MAGLTALVALTILMLADPLPSTFAQACPEVQVVFARGSGEDPGVGRTGQAFVDVLRSLVGGMSLDVYPVNYRASRAWDTGLDGVRDAGAHVVSMASDCPNTQMVLGGYSQGAAVMGFVTAPARAGGTDIDSATMPEAMAPAIASHVSAVVLFGMPNGHAMNFLNEPRAAVRSLYRPKTIQLCAPRDPVCAADGVDPSLHSGDVPDRDMVDKGARFAADHLDGLSPRPDPVVRSSHGSFAI